MKNTLHQMPEFTQKTSQPPPHATPIDIYHEINNLWFVTYDLYIGMTYVFGLHKITKNKLSSMLLLNVYGPIFGNYVFYPT